MTGRFGRWLLAVFLAASIPLLYSCGGGGGDGGGGGNNDAFSVSPSSISFTAAQGTSAPVGQMVTITVLKGSVFFGNSTITQSGGFFTRGSFQLTGPTTGQFFIQPETPFTAGTFTGSVSVRGCSNPTCDGSDAPGSPKVISVKYTVTPAPTLTSTPVAVNFTTMTTNVPANLPASKTITLALTSGSSAWTAGAVNYTSGNPGWLNVTPTSGTLNPSQLVTFDVTDASTAGVYNASVTFTAGALTKIVPVSLVVNDPRANFVSPYVVPTGSVGDVIIRGIGFLTLNGPTLQVLFGATPATSVQRISDTEIHASYPSLAAGNYPITVGDGTITLASRAALKLVVISPPAYAAAVVPRAASPTGAVNLIYDGERQALYLMDSDTGRLERYSFAAGSWSLNGTNSTGNTAGALNVRSAFSPDGTEILKTAGGEIVRIDPATLLTITKPVASINGALLFGNQIAFANDGGAIGSALPTPTSAVSLYRYDMLTQQFTALSNVFDMVNRQIVASGNGDTLVMPSTEYLILALSKPVFILDASGGTTLTQMVPTTSGAESASVSRSGARMIIRTLQSDFNTDNVARVYDYDGVSLTVRGNLPAHDSGFVISPDGNTAYAYYSGTGLVRKFDLVNPAFPETGSTIVTSPGTFTAAMTISPDGGTLFLAGNQQVVIVPAP